MRLRWGISEVQLRKRNPRDTYFQCEPEPGVLLSMRREQDSQMFVLVARMQMQQRRFVNNSPQVAVDEALAWVVERRRDERWMAIRAEHYQQQIERT